QSWVEHNPSPHLWVHGLPGSGKSVLAANTINFLQENPSSICAYFFCNYGEPAKRSADSIVRTIASQVARSSEPSLTALTKLRLSHYNLTRPIPLLWQHLVLEVVGLLERHIYIVIDGLDECDEEERKLLMDIIISTKQGGNISWMVFSRYLSDIADFIQSPVIALEPDDTAQDMTDYIEHCIN